MTALMTVLAPDEASERAVRAALRREGLDLQVVSRDQLLGRLDEADAELVVVLADGLTPEGQELCSQVRQRTDTRLVLFSSSRNDTDELLAFSAGCDDVIRTPCRDVVVAARLRARLYRAREDSQRCWRYDCLTVDPVARRVRVRQREVPLTRTEFEILAALVEHPRQVVTRDHLLERVWRGCARDDHVLEVHLSRLRAKILAAGGPVVGDPVPGVGYRAGRGACPPPGEVLSCGRGRG